MIKNKAKKSKRRHGTKHFAMLLPQDDPSRAAYLDPANQNDQTMTKGKVALVGHCCNHHCLRPQSKIVLCVRAVFSCKRDLIQETVLLLLQ